MEKYIHYFSSDIDGHFIEISFYTTVPEEYKEIRNFLDKIPHITYTYLDAFTIRAIIRPNNYESAIAILKKLESNGWVFG